MSEQAHHSGVKIYYYIFGALMFLTIVTVLASFLQVGVALGVTIALFIAVIKSSLVASFFMHLISEKKLIYYALVTTILLVVCMMSLFIFSYYNLPEGSQYIMVEPATKSDAHHGEEAGGAPAEEHGAEHGS